MPNNYGFHCTGCPYRAAQHLSPADRQVRATPLSMEDNGGAILLIFQAPGVNEWEKGLPIISNQPGSAGVRLASAFRKVGKIRGDFNITNTVQCFPGKLQATSNIKPRDKPPNALARKHCAHWLQNDIKAHKYERVVVFGSEAKNAVYKLGYANDPRFQYLRHPSGGLSNIKLFPALT